MKSGTIPLVAYAGACGRYGRVTKKPLHTEIRDAFPYYRIDSYSSDAGLFGGLLRGTKPDCVVYNNETWDMNHIRMHAGIAEGNAALAGFDTIEYLKGFRSGKELPEVAEIAVSFGFDTAKLNGILEDVPVIMVTMANRDGHWFFSPYANIEAIYDEELRLGAIAAYGPPEETVPMLSRIEEKFFPAAKVGRAWKS